MDYAGLLGTALALPIARRGRTDGSGEAREEHGQENEAPRGKGTIQEGCAQEQDGRETRRRGEKGEGKKGGSMAQTSCFANCRETR